MRRLLGVGVGLLGLALIVLGLQAGPARLRPGHPDFVNGDRPGINAHNSPSVAVEALGRSAQIT